MNQLQVLSNQSDGTSAVVGRLVSVDDDGKVVAAFFDQSFMDTILVQLEKAWKYDQLNK